MGIEPSRQGPGSAGDRPRLFESAEKATPATGARLGGLRFLGAVARQHRRSVSLSFGLNLTAALFESSTIGILVLALEVLAGDASAASAAALPAVGPWLAELGGRFGQDGLFLVLVGLAVATQLGVSGLEFSSRAATARLQAEVEGDLRSRIFRQLMSMSYGQVMRHRVGELAAYNDHVNYVGHVIQLLNLIAAQLIMMVAYLAILLWLSWPLTIGALAAALVLSAALRRIIRRIRELGRRFTQAGISLSARTVEFLRGIRLVRTFGREELAIRLVEDAIYDGVEHRRRGLTWNAAIGPLADALTVLGVGVFLVGGYLFLYDGRPAALPRLIGFLFVLYRLLPRIKFVNDRLGHVNSHWEFVRRVEAVLRTDDKELEKEGGRPFPGLARGVEYRSVSLRYVDASDWALRDVSFSLPRGAVVGLVGESGAGKSSVADLLLGLYRPTAGTIEVDGVDLQEIDWSDWRRHLGIVSQEAFIFHASARENIAFGRFDAGAEEVEAAARAADAHEFITRLAEGYDTILGDQGYRLSAGQRQRIALARAILRDPEILVLDEATSQLDSRSEREIQRSLARIGGERTVLIIAHRLSTLVGADQILVLEGGRLVERGRHDELLAAGGRYAELWRLQSLEEPEEERARPSAEAKDG